MLPSTEREYQEKIKKEQHRASEQYALGVRKCIGVINRAEYLTLEQKEMLTKEINK